jgi:hypothetical protein
MMPAVGGYYIKFAARRREFKGGLTPPGFVPAHRSPPRPRRFSGWMKRGLVILPDRLGAKTVVPCAET